MSTERDPDELLTPSDAARVLGLAPDTVRQLANKGRLKVMKTMTGRRLFRRADVELLAKERAHVPESLGEKQHG